jgi:hypothetical protein
MTIFEAKISSSPARTFQINLKTNFSTWITKCKGIKEPVVFAYDESNKKRTVSDPFFFAAPPLGLPFAV